MSDFFAINMPYGIARNENKEWIAFNRAYRPLGHDSNYPSFQLTKGNDNSTYIKYKGIKESILLKLAVNETTIGRDENNTINQIWFYNDKTNPMKSDVNWNAYIEKIKIVSKFKL